METFVRLYYDHKHSKPFMMEKIKPELNILGFVYKYIETNTQLNLIRFAMKDCLMLVYIYIHYRSNGLQQHAM